MALLSDFLTGVVLTLCITALSWGLWILWDRRRVWVALGDSDGGVGEVLKGSPNARGHIVVKHNGVKKAYPPDARSVLAGSRPLHIFHSVYGWAMRFPSAREVITSRKVQHLSVVDPSLLYRAYSHNDHQEALTANQQEKMNLGRVFLVVGVLAAIVGLIWLLTSVL